MDSVRAVSVTPAKQAFFVRAWAFILPGVVVILAAILRLTALGYDLPYIFHPDEPVYVNIIQRIYQGDLNPHFFNYPTLFFYLNALIYLPYLGIARLLGHPVAVLPSTSLVMGTTLAQTPEAVLVSRGVSVLFGLGAIVMVYLLGRSLTRSHWAGLLAALLLAISPTAIKINRFITPDTFVVFFILATAFFSLRLYRSGRQVDYLLAGICAGLAASSKYNAGLAVTAPLAAHFLRHGWNGLVEFKIYRAILACGLAFLFTSPFVLLDAGQFWQDFTYEARHYATGHAGMEGNTLNWYLAYLWRVEGGGVVLGGLMLLLGFVLGLVRKENGTAQGANHTPQKKSDAPGWFKEGLVTFAFPVLYFIFISRFIVRNDRTLLPVIPFLLLAAALLINRAFLAAKHHETQQGERHDWKLPAWMAVGALSFLTALVVPLVTIFQFAAVAGQPVPEEQARQWIETNLPAGTRIAIESYSPYLDSTRYDITPQMRAILKDAGWYRSQGIEYVVFAKAMYGRYYCDPERYYVEQQQYEHLFNAFSEVMVFENPAQVSPINGIAQQLGDQSLCPPQADLIYTHEVKIYQVP